MKHSIGFTTYHSMTRIDSAVFGTFNAKDHSHIIATHMIDYNENRREAIHSLSNYMFLPHVIIASNSKTPFGITDEEIRSLTFE